MNISIRQLLTVDAIISEGSIKSAAKKLHRTHPSIMAAVKKIEEELGFDIFNRSGYRMVLTHRGNEFFKAAQPILDNYLQLSRKVSSLQKNEDQQINIVIGDVTAPSLLTRPLAGFSASNPDIQINLYSESIMGPQERLLDGHTDISIHHIDEYNTDIETIPLGTVTIIPVSAPDYFSSQPDQFTTFNELKNYTQCVIRCTTRHTPSRDYFLIDGHPSISVDSQIIKKSVIVEGMAWGHLPDFLISQELASGQLVSISGKNIRSNTLKIVAARRSNISHDNIAQKFWEFLKQVDSRNGICAPVMMKEESL